MPDLLLLTSHFGHNFGVFSFFAHSLHWSLVDSSLFALIPSIEVRSPLYFTPVLIKAVAVNGPNWFGGTTFSLPQALTRVWWL
jgi:hypothetical protein